LLQRHNTTLRPPNQCAIPAFIADKATKNALDIPESQTAYALWIGTNDLGNNAFLTNSQVKGKNLTDFVNCVEDTLDKLYAAGARYVVLMNVVPLNLGKSLSQLKMAQKLILSAPQYATPENGGVRMDKFWNDKPADVAAVSRNMSQEVKFVNDEMKNRVTSLSNMAKKFPGSHFALFDTHSLVDIRPVFKMHRS